MVEIELPRPRTVEMLTSEAFMAIKRRIMHLIHHLIHEEAMRSVATERPAIMS
jgi:predicted DNA-binding helix-hairpin-helix protein